jgi:hypothetical protein
MRHLIDVATDLGERGVGFRSLTENIDTITLGGRLIFHVIAAVAEFERETLPGAVARGDGGGTGAGPDGWAADGDDPGQSPGGAADV